MLVLMLILLLHLLVTCWHGNEASTGSGADACLGGVGGATYQLYILHLWHDVRYIVVVAYIDGAIIFITSPSPVAANQHHDNVNKTSASCQ